MSVITVSKFGGSSMKDHEAMLRSAKISLEQNSKVVLVSATYGTTDKLHTLIHKAETSKWDECEKILFSIRENHYDILQNLKNDPQIKENVKELINNLETLTRGIFLIGECSDKIKDRIVSFGERVSSILFTQAMKLTITDKPIILLDTREVLRTDSTHGKAKPILADIKKLCSEKINLATDTIYVGQGYIGSDEKGATTTLGRGGSDYSAALLAEAIDADKLEIWTDVAGIATTDPKICKTTKAIHEISYNEASEMAQYGAKILHPTTLLPAMRSEIPVFVGSSYAKEAKGTWIKKDVEEKPLIRAITKRSHQALLTIRTPKMLNAFGFMEKIFGIFSRYEISVDCVTTSEISIAVTVEKETLENEKFIQELNNIGEVITEHGHTLISLIGNNMLKQPGLAKRIFNSIDEVNVRMLCLGASAYNFNILVQDEQGDYAITKLHQEFIG
jgi:aspartate kinase